MNIPFDLRQLRAFCSLARTGSFTQTARELHLTQSAVSHSMKSLERETGCRLLDRMGKKAILTQAGEQFLRHAQKISEESIRASESLVALRNWGHGRLRIGASITACQYILPGVLRDFKESFPDHSIALEPGDTPDLVEALADRRIDLAFCLEPAVDRQTEVERLFTDELVFIVDPSHPWVRRGRVDRAEIGRQNYILYRKTSVTSILVWDYFKEEEIELKTVIQAGSMEATKELVKAGLGISILAPWIARKEIEEGSLVPMPLGRRPLKRHWAILHWQNKRLNLAEEKFIALCRSFCRGALQGAQ